MNKLIPALLMVAAATVFAPAPASAAVPGLTVLSRVTVADSVSPKTAQATCPTGTLVIGAGVIMDGLGTAVGRVIVDDLRVTSTSVLATGYEIQGGTADLWWIRAYAICANPLPGYEIITASSASTSASPKTVSANCSAGKRAVGAGGMITGGLGQVVMTAMQPSTAGAVTVAAEDADGTAANWQAVSYAICADPLPGLELISVKSATDSANKSVPLVCNPGKSLLSMGWEIATTTGTVYAEMSRPESPALVYARELGAGVATNWTLGARIVCATP